MHTWSTKVEDPSHSPLLDLQLKVAKVLDLRGNTHLAEPGFRFRASRAVASAMRGEDRGLLAAGVP